MPLPCSECARLFVPGAPLGPRPLENLEVPVLRTSQLIGWQPICTSLKSNHRDNGAFGTTVCGPRGYSRDRAHCSTSRCPPDAAYTQMRLSKVRSFKNGNSFNLKVGNSFKIGNRVQTLNFRGLGRPPMRNLRMGAPHWGGLIFVRQM